MSKRKLFASNSKFQIESGKTWAHVFTTCMRAFMHESLLNLKGAGRRVHIELVAWTLCIFEFSSVSILF